MYGVRHALSCISRFQKAGTLSWTQLHERLRQGERSQQLFRALGQYGVSVYARQFQTPDEGGALELLEDDSAILIDLSLYSDDTGLAFDVEI